VGVGAPRVAPGVAAAVGASGVGGVATGAPIKVWQASAAMGRPANARRLIACPRALDRIYRVTRSTVRPAN
jgi:hypothetical protein